VVRPAMNGELEDPTHGAVYFLNPTLQRKLGRAMPAWARGHHVKIGNQVYYPGEYGEEREAHASGGAVKDQHHEMLVNRLMSMAKSAKKATDKATEPLLNVPDEHIVKALDVAQRAI
jgi:Cell Wall Hydrolase